jgi:hypothetical protein
VGVSAIKKVCILLMSLASVLGAVAQKVPEDQAPISGRVVDVSSSPYSAQVRIFQIVIREGFASLYPMCVTNTDQQGGFECPKLSAGKFIVQVLSLRRWGKQTQKAQDVAAGTIPPDRTEYEAGFGLPPFEDRGSGSHFAIFHVTSQQPWELQHVPSSVLRP